jgi:hypothetical protein
LFPCPAAGSLFIFFPNFIGLLRGWKRHFIFVSVINRSYTSLTQFLNLFNLLFQRNFIGIDEQALGGVFCKCRIYAQALGGMFGISE